MQTTGSLEAVYYSRIVLYTSTKTYSNSSLAVCIKPLFDKFLIFPTDNLQAGSRASHGLINNTDTKAKIFHLKNLPLKVDGNEMTGVGKEIVLQTRYSIVAIKSYLQFERVVSL
jgi:hypothetical protein